MSKGKEKKEVVISTENLNSYGSRVLTGGIDISQYQRNPILLYMHRRFGADDTVIGRVENLRFEDNRLIGTPVFDMDDPFAKKIALKWENDFLRMVSPSLEMIETSDAPDLLLAGQLRPTVTKSKLIELSVVDIGGNDDALRLMKGGKVLELSHGGECEALPLLELNNKAPEGNNQLSINENSKEMEKILLALGLNKDATSEQAVAKVLELQKQAEKADTIELAAITGSVNGAIAAKRITYDQKEHFINLGKSAGLETLNATLELMKPSTKPTDHIDAGAGGNAGKLELKWQDLTPEAAEKMKKDSPKEYAQLFKAEFGCEPY